MLAGAPDAAAAAAGELLAWYDTTRRELPWRRRRDPYAIWLSEIMLQQTRVDSVVERYEAFLRRFPDVASLAAASEEEVLGAWSGLGYYRRARTLHRAARQLVGSEWPRTAATWRRLPGVGEYTAAAIASIAFGEVVAVLDGNVERVVSRLLAATEDPKRAAPRRRLRAAATALLDAARPGDSNQALMELGATVCKPQAPRCEACPLAARCAGLAAGAPRAYPSPRRRPAGERVARRVFVARRGERVLLFRRPEDARQLAGFWELPWLDGAAGGEAEPGVELGRKYGGEWRVTEGLGRVDHSITRRRFTIQVFAARRLAGGVAEPSSGDGRWCDEATLATLAVSSLVRKVMARAAAP
jgi:A/G-specific adenine glycosylase